MSQQPDRVARAARLSNRFAGSRRARRFGRLHAALYRLSRGRLGGRWLGSPVVVLETTGRRSGKTRRTPVLGLREGDSFVVLAANAGADRTPSWWLNLRQASAGYVIAGGRRTAIVPRELEGAERERLWARFVAMHPASEHYRAFTVRELPLIALDPA